MSRQFRLLLGISVFWLALSVLFDGINTLVLPVQIGALAGKQNQATTLGLLTFMGLLAGALIQPVAGAFSDRLRARLGRKGFIGIGLILSLLSLLLFAINSSLMGLIVGYLAVQVSASVAQAGQQGLLPDLVETRRRGLASGFKGFMDIGGAMLGFVLLGQLLGSGRPLLAIGAIGGILIATYLLAVLLTPEDRPDRTRERGTIGISLAGIFRLDWSANAGFVRLVLARFLFLLGTYAIGRFMLLFVASRLGLSDEQAAAQAGNLLAALAFVTVTASPLAGWLSDRLGRLPLMIVGALLSALSAALLIWARTSTGILLIGSLMSLGSAAFAGGSWALLADFVPKDESARFFGMANFGTAGAAAAAGLFGPLVDGADRLAPGMGFTFLFIAASLAFLASILPLRNGKLKEVGENHGNKGKESTDGRGLAVVHLPADPARVEKDPHSP